MKINRLHIGILFFVAGFLCIPKQGTAQLSPSLYQYPNNHLPWYTIESEHFKVHFQQGNSRSAQMTSTIAEEIYPDVTSLYQLEPDSKTNIVLNDRQDYSNGAAYFFDNQIEIWVPALDTPFRGTHDWLWDVITHEFTHIVQLQHEKEPENSCDLLSSRMPMSVDRMYFMATRMALSPIRLHLLTCRLGLPRA